MRAVVTLIIGWLVALAALLYAEVPSDGSKAVLEAEFAAEVALTDLQVAVVRLDLPMRYDAVFRILGGATTLRWAGRHSRSFGEHRITEDTFDVISGPLAGRRYVVVLEARELVDESSHIDRVSVGYRTPLGTIFFADHRYAEAVIKAAEKKGEPGATDNPDDAQRLREDH